MSDWLGFGGRIEAVEWGRATYTVLRLPSDVAEALLAQGARRVEGEINDHPVSLALSRASVVEGLFPWTGRTLLDRPGVTPGEALEVRLRPAPASGVETPDDLALAPRQAGATEAWEALTPGRRRGLLHRVESARTAPTRVTRIAAIVADLGGPA